MSEATALPTDPQTLLIFVVESVADVIGVALNVVVNVAAVNVGVNVAEFSGVAFNVASVVPIVAVSGVASVVAIVDVSSTGSVIVDDDVIYYAVVTTAGVSFVVGRLVYDVVASDVSAVVSVSAGVNCFALGVVRCTPNASN